MKRLLIALTAAGFLAGAGLAFYLVDVRANDPYGNGPGLWTGIVLPLVLLLIGLGFGAWSLSDNIYDIKAGQVINHDFTPAHTTPPTYMPGTPGTSTSPGTPAMYIPGQHVPDDWALELKDAQGRTGWLHFSEDVFAKYPVGSYYGARSAGA